MTKETTMGGFGTVRNGAEEGPVLFGSDAVTAMLDAIEAAMDYVDTAPDARTLGQAEDLCGFLDRVHDLIGDDDA